MRHPRATENTLKQFKAAGYRTQVIVVAVPRELSLMGTLTRYVNQILAQGQDRWVNPMVHDEAATQLIETLSNHIANGVVDKIDIVERSGKELFSKTISDTNRMTIIEQTLAAIEKVDDLMDSMKSNANNGWPNSKQSKILSDSIQT